MSSSTLNSYLKRWPGWLALLFVVVALLAVGVSRDNGPQTPDERIVALEKRLACPVCQGESVYESRNSASVQIRELIRQGVEEGQLSDQQIIDGIVTRYNGEELLVPTSSGVEALAWALPAACQRRNAKTNPATPATKAAAGNAHANASTPLDVGTSNSSPL